MSENGDMQNKNEADCELVSKLTSNLLSDPVAFEAIGKQLLRLAGKSSGYIESLPKSVKRRLKALKKLQFEVFQIESNFFEEVHQLECKYSELYKPLFKKRSDIINAVNEPTDSECEWESDEECCQEKECSHGDVEAVAGVPDRPDNGDQLKIDENAKGVPMFWLTALNNAPQISCLIDESETEALSALTDIRVTFNDGESKEMFFELIFEFAENKYFENSTLTKRYYLDPKPNPKYPMTFEGPEIVKSTGCTINWKEGMDMTTKKDWRSFFSIFSPTEFDPTDKNLTEVELADLESNQLIDFEVGQTLQASIVPKAVLYFTGEAVTDDEDDDDDCEDESHEGEGEYEEDNDDDYKPPKGKANGQECKQQ